MPSAQVKPGQTITLSAKAPRTSSRCARRSRSPPEPPAYLYRNKDEGSGTLSRYPERDEIPLPVPVDERLIVEFYA